MLNQNTGMNLAKRFIFFPVFHCLMFILADSKCQKSFQCGNLGSLEFPLFDTQPDCGLFRVDGCDSGNPRIQLGAGGFWYDILQKVSANELLIREPRLQNQLNSNSCFSLRNLSLPKYPYSSFTIFPNLTLFTCVNRSSSQPIQDYFQNYESTNCQNSTAYYRNPANESAPGLRSIPSQCSVVQLPKKANISSSELLNMLTGEFNLEWHVSDACYECHRGGGQCQSNGMDEFWCRKSGGVSVATVTTASIILCIFIWKKHRALLELLGFQHAQTDQEKSIEIFLKNHGNLAQRRYTYSDLKKMTHSFSDRLGKGGYGTVYKGKLPDGRLVAVKILNESEGNGEEFINEVASISKTSHVNIVALLGFCFEGSKRALIYEFMPSGSLEKFINNPTSSYQLGWQKLFDIVIGIAERAGLPSSRLQHTDISL